MDTASASSIRSGRSFPRAGNPASRDAASTRLADAHFIGWQIVQSVDNPSGRSVPGSVPLPASRPSGDRDAARPTSATFPQRRGRARRKPHRSRPAPRRPRVDQGDAVQRHERSGRELAQLGNRLARCRRSAADSLGVSTRGDGNRPALEWSSTRWKAAIAASCCSSSSSERPRQRCAP
jgi:hypothetical protein